MAEIQDDVKQKEKLKPGYKQMPYSDLKVPKHKWF